MVRGSNRFKPIIELIVKICNGSIVEEYSYNILFNKGTVNFLSSDF